MEKQNKIPQTYLENIDMINSATQLIDEKSNILLLNSNPNININSNTIQNNPKTTNSFFFNTNTNSFYRTKNDNSTNLQSPIQKETFNNFKDINKLNKLNYTHKFAWKEIMNNNLIDDDNELDNPLIINILNSKLNENDIQNIPENYLLNLINTLQGVANKAIENKNELQLDNKRLYNDLSDLKNDYNYIIKTNNKMNKTLNQLKKENHEQKKLIRNYHNDNYENNIYNIRIQNNYKQKFSCKYCSNKKFKSKYYLDKHIQRRHPDTYEVSPHLESLEQKKRNLEKKLEDMKKYFDILINASIKKTQYMRLNEKINSLQNLILMSKHQKNLYNNYINNIDNYNNNYEDEKNDEKENDSEEAHEKEKNIKKQIQQLKYEMNHFFNKSKTELYEIIREKHFQSIKNYFEKNQKRRDKKIKTIKVLQSINIDKDNEINNSADEINTDLKESQKIIDIYQSHKKIGKDILRTAKTTESFKNNKNNLFNANNDNKNANEDANANKNANIKEDINNNNIINDINNTNNNNINKENENINNINNIVSRNESHKESDESARDRNVKKIQILSLNSEKSNQSNQLSPLEKFYDDLRERDGNFSKFKKEDYLKEIINKDDNIDDEKKDEIEKIVDKKIKEKLSNVNFGNNEDLVSDIIKLNLQILDQNYIYGDVYCFYSRNISMLMNTKEYINEANNYYYHYNQGKNLKSLVDRSREANINLFETVNYQVQNSSFVSEISLRYNN